MADYEHRMSFYDKRPNDLAKHLRDEHHVEPKTVIAQSYKRSVWGSQHDQAHKDYAHETDGGTEMDPDEMFFLEMEVGFDQTYDDPQPEAQEGR